MALFTGNYNYVMDGPARTLNMLVDFLGRRGHEAVVFAPTGKKPVLEHAGTLISVPSVPFPGRGEYRLGVAVPGSARKTLERLKPDIIHIAAPDILGLTALRYARKRNIPVVASFHTRFDAYPRYYKMRWLEKPITRYLQYFYRRCEHVYAPSPSMAAALRADGIGRDVRLWTRGVDSDLFNPGKRDFEWRRAQGFADDDVVGAFVGRLVLEKGIEVFADAFAQLVESRPNARALIVGDGPERARFAQSLPGGVFTGYVQGDELARAYASADIFFNPSITETFGNVTLEAMASGIPSVCAKAAGSISLIEHGRTGFVCAPEEGAAGYADALRRLASDPDLRARIGADARSKSLEFNWDTVLDALVDHYQEAINGYRRRAPAQDRSARAISRNRAA
ncbi:MAG: glycosyltransferase family 4 protein [Parvularculaceae bacterium]